MIRNIQAMLQYRNMAYSNPGENKTMSRKKLASRVLQTAERRASGPTNIDPQLDLGGVLTLPTYESAISNLAARPRGGVKIITVDKAMGN
jgi:hypothetical protein